MREVGWRGVWALAMSLALLVVTTGCGDFDEAAGPAPVPEAIAPAMGPVTGGQLIAIRGRGFTGGSAVLFDGVPAEDVRVVSDAVITCIAPPHVAGRATVRVYDVHGRFGELEDAYEYVPSLSVEGRPRVVGAVSTGNTSVRVVFSEPVRDGADDPRNFSIRQAHVNPESATLPVLSATPSEDFIAVDLVTSSQTEVIYQLTVSNVRDFDGNLIAPPELLVDPAVATFAGTPPRADEIVDGDGDGIPDHVELAGWTVTVFLTNGDVVRTTVTSDPELADTDGDGLGDADELIAGTNPRNADTDGDMVPDVEEWNVWWSDPCDQDSDDDTLADGIELWLRTSAILDDTDGDGVEDAVEQFELSRNPLVADLPRPQIVVGGYDLQVDVRNSYTDETGTVRSTESSVSTSFSQATASSQTRSDTRSTQAENTFSQNLGVEFSWGGGNPWGGKVTSSLGFEQSYAHGYSSTVSSETSRESSQSWERSVAEAFQESQNRSITRTVEGARIVATVNVANAGTVPFTIQNLEISVLRQDRAVGGAFRPVATLRPRGELSLNLGPFDSERGPIVFENSDIFPAVVDEILREPTGLVFKVANFDVTDEDGRNFAYTSATVNSRTAGVTIDFGDGRTESYRIATSDRFDGDGRPTGISIERALEIIGLGLVPDDAPLPATEPPGGWPASVRNSVGTVRGADGIERLVRVRTVQTSLDARDPQKRYWTIQTNNTSLSENTSFSDIRLHAGQEYLILYVRDLDEDGLYDREELLYGSSDYLTDTDGDGLHDREEVREGWSVLRVGSSSGYRVFPSPARADSDGDGLDDRAERGAGTDPNRADTDFDGVSDGIEVAETLELELFDGDLDDGNNLYLTLVPYSDFVLLDGGNGTFDGTVGGDDQLIDGATDGVWLDPGPNGVIDSTPAGDDRIVLLQAIAPGPDGRCETYTLVGDDVQVKSGAAGPGERCVHGGADGLLQTEPTGDDFVRALHAGMFVLDPLSDDTDLDGLTDGRELALGTNPNARDAGSVTDSDQDGLYDAEETLGWEIEVNGTRIRVTSNPLRPDTDGDGLPDVYERVLGTNPRVVDTDGDTLSDHTEVSLGDGWWTDPQRITVQDRCRSAVRCSFSESSSVTHSDPRRRDTDGDTLDDDVELAGWTVTVGTSVRHVTSSPGAADTDRDGLRDDAERAHGTDPGDSDTDDDLGSDWYELNPPSEWSTVGPRNPLVPDRWVSTRVRARVVGDCDSGNDGGNFEGSLTSDHRYITYDFARCAGVAEGAYCPDGTTNRFIMQEGGGESYWVVGVVDRDPDDATDDDTLENFEGDARLTWSSIEGQAFSSFERHNKVYDNDDSCAIAVIVEVTAR